MVGVGVETERQRHRAKKSGNGMVSWTCDCPVLGWDFIQTTSSHTEVTPTLMTSRCHTYSGQLTVSLFSTHLSSSFFFTVCDET